MEWEGVNGFYGENGMNERYGKKENGKLACKLAI